MYERCYPIRAASRHPAPPWNSRIHRIIEPLIIHPYLTSCTQSEDCLMHATCFRRDKTGRLSDFRLAVLMSVISHQPKRTFSLPRQLQSAWSNVPLGTKQLMLVILGCRGLWKRLCTSEIFSNSQSSTGLHWIMLHRWQIWQMYQMYQTLKLIVKEFLSLLIAMRRPEWMCPPMGPPKHLTCATVARFRTKLFTSRKKDHHFQTHQTPNFDLTKSKRFSFYLRSYPKKSPTVNLNEVVWSIIPWSQSKRTETKYFFQFSSIFHHWRLRHLFCSTKGRTQDSIGIVAEGHTQVLQWKGNFRSRFFWNKQWGKCSDHQMTRERG